MSSYALSLFRSIGKFGRDLVASLGARETTPVDILRMSNPDLPFEIELPRYATPGAAGLDLRAAIPKQIILGPGKVAVIPTGLKMAIRDPNIVAMIFPRGGKGTKEGLILANGTGVVDSDYRGEVMIPVCNRNLNQNVTIDPNERIAQMVLMPAIMAQFHQVQQLEATERGEGRFSSTGKH